MKKALCILFSLLLLLSLCACGDSSTDSANDTAASTAESPAAV